MQKKYILPGTQLALMLASRGGEFVYSMPIFDADADKDDYIYALQKMAGQGIVENDGPQLRICEPYRSFVDMMVGAKLVLFLRSGDRSLPDVCIYCSDSDKMLVSEPISVRHNNVCLHMETVASLTNALEDDGYLPEYSADSVDADVSAYLNDAETVFASLHKKETISDVRLLLGLSVINVPNDSKNGVVVLQTPVGTGLFGLFNGKWLSSEYSKDGFIRIITEIVKGEAIL